MKVLQYILPELRRKERFLMFEKGHVFVYGASGVCRVEDICVRDYGAGKKEYYILQPVFDLRSSLSVPVDSPVFENHARELLQKEEIAGVKKSEEILLSAY